VNPAVDDESPPGPGEVKVERTRFVTFANLSGAAGVYSDGDTTRLSRP